MPSGSTALQRVDADFLLAPVQPGVGPRAYGPEQVAAAEAIVGRWPGYAPTPLRRLDRLAASLGLGAVWYKDEGARFGVGSFKALGAAHALSTELHDLLPDRPGVEELLAGHPAAAGVTVTCATDGNLGRAVAWAARRLGCACRIHVHPGVSPGRRAAMADFGAEVVEVPGTYDDAVRRCAEEARAHGWLELSDTAYAGFERIPGRIMQGYTVLVAEAARQMPPPERISHIVVQAGVGGLAAATLDAAAGLPALSASAGIVVEACQAACLFASAEAGELRAVGGALDTIMAGLACGVPSTTAWRLLDGRARAFLRLADDDAIAAMRLLAAGEGDGRPVIGGETGVAGLAGLVAVARDGARRAAVGLGPESRVLVIGSEGATDAALWQHYVGRSPWAIAALDARAGPPEVSAMSRSG